MVIQDDNGDHVCKHGVSMDVHCCGCHSGFIFDFEHVCLGSFMTPEVLDPLHAVFQKHGLASFEYSKGLVTDLIEWAIEMNQQQQWTVAAGHPPPLYDCRKLVRLVEQDGMVWVGIRTYNHGEGYWCVGNQREESATVTHWADLPDVLVLGMRP